MFLINKILDYLFPRSDAAAIIFILLILVWLLFKGDVHFFGEI